ncbi:hypothetical protein [Vulcanisaeta souniana]|uniref:Uncharacterized protein n=1 Tax=Vulcanisaeta souniana JCM 11219 TaxID=1293586 RepID=A0A830E9G8_9CREN|nr:hypothetical protein [Vulcanisaeta souniana]BDR93470.1 hypothetical protein Vsou_25630 [Vulcanisaeta souniana JCM 11219]GGI77409.1 hypothetical protein GCM10007112_12740 [Vulcanisaeta souniana JCM 11219]
MNNEDDMKRKEISELINKAKNSGFLEELSISDAIDDIMKSTGEEVNLILYVQGGEPMLINAAKEEDYVSLALLDLDLIVDINLEEFPSIAQLFNDLEELTTKIGYELHGDRSIAPFLFPLRLDVSNKRAMVACGIKAAITEELFNENFMEGLIEDLGFNYMRYLSELLGSITRREGQSP